MKRSFISLFATCLFLFAGIAYFAQAPSVDAARWPRTVDITYCWQTTTVDPQCPQQRVILSKGPRTLEVVDPNNNVLETGTWTWDRNTKTIVMSFDSYPDLTYTGVQQGQCYRGTMEALNSGYTYTGAWEGCW